MHDYELYGFSLFETFLANRGSFWRLDRHWHRLSTAAPALGLSPPSWDRFKSDIAEIHDPKAMEILRYTLLREGGRWSTAATGTRTQILKKPFEPQTSNPVRLDLAEARFPCGDSMRGFKSGSRLRYQLLFEEARSRGFDDCVLCDQQDRLLETTTSNLLFLIGDRWVTPPSSLGLLPGIARGWLLERGLIHEYPIVLKDLPSIEAAFSANAVHGFRPVRRLAQRELSTEISRSFLDHIGNRNFTALKRSRG